MHQQISNRAHLVDNGVCLARGQQEEDHGEEEEEQLRQALWSDANASSHQESKCVACAHAWWNSFFLGCTP